MEKAKSPSRNLLLITLGFPPAHGGIQSCLFARARLAADQIVVLAPDMPGARQFDPLQSFPVHRWPATFAQVKGLKRLCQLVYSFTCAWRLCSRYPIRHVECGQALPFGVTALALRILRGIPYRVWAYGDDITKPANWPVIRSLLRCVLLRAETVLAISHFTGRQVRALGIPAERLHVITPLLDQRRFAYAAEGSERIMTTQDGELTLLTVARLEWRKGIQTVIRMLPALRERFPSLRYRVVGAGSAREALESRAADLGASAHVEFAGEVSDEVLSGHYRASDLFVMLPTPEQSAREVEGYGMVYLEAALHALPTVAWRTGGVEEAVIQGETGLLVDEGDAEAALQAILSLLADETQRRQMGHNAHTRARQIVSDSIQALTDLDGQNAQWE